VICQGGGSNLYPPEMEGTFTPEEIQERIYGSKIVVVSEQAMLNVIYTIKACMLIMYTRLTLGLAAQRAVRWLAIYVAVGWVATETAFFTACRPFAGYYAMPPPDAQCTTLEHYAIVQGCFNISSDLLMLFIPLPLVLKMRMPWRQKAVLVLVFSLGIFVILAALLTKIFNLTNVWDPSYMLWYIREASVAVYVSNLPMIWPLLRDWLPCLRNLTTQPTPGKSSRQKGGGSTLPSSSGMRYGLGSRATAVGRAGRRDSLGSSDSAYGIEMTAKRGAGQSHDGSSTEYIIGGGGLDDGVKHGGGMQVTVERTVTVREHTPDSRAGSHVDVEQGLFDWDHMGTAEHRTAVISRR